MERMIVFMPNARTAILLFFNIYYPTKVYGTRNETLQEDIKIRVK